MRISDWSSDVCSSDLRVAHRHQEFARLTRRDDLLDKMALGIEFGVRLRDGVPLLLHRRQIDDVVGDLVVDALAVRRLDATVFVDAAERGEAVDQPYVQAFRPPDRADAATSRRLDGAHLEARPPPG